MKNATRFSNMISVIDSDTDERRELIGEFSPHIKSIFEEGNTIFMIFNDESFLILHSVNNDIDTMYEGDSAEEFVNLIYVIMKHSDDKLEKDIYTAVERRFDFESEFMSQEASQ